MTTTVDVMTKQVVLLALVLAVGTTCQSGATATDGASSTSTSDGDGDGNGDGDGDGDESRSVLLHVTTPDAVGIPKAIVTIEGQVHFTDNAGFLHIDNPPGDDFSARIDAAGYTSGTVKLELSDGLHAYADVQLFALSDPLPLDAELGGTVERDGVSVTFPPGALVNRFGEFVTGNVDVTITVLDPTQDDQLRALPGPLEARTALDEDVLLLTLGMTEISLWQEGYPIQLAPDTTATLTLAIPATLADGLELGQQIPAWSLDLDEGIWVEESMGIVESIEDALVWTAEVSHFTWYNCDALAQPQEFECFFVTMKDADGDLVGRGFTLSANYQSGVFIDGGQSSQSITNVVSNCAQVPIGSTPEMAIPNIPEFEYEIIGATGTANLCREDGVANSDCGLIEVTLPPQAPPVICQMGAYMACPYTGPMNTENVGACEAGHDYCINAGTAWSGCVGEFTPALNESCATPWDDDCDGMSDEPDAVDCECSLGDSIPCYSGPLGTQDVGECVAGIRTCDPAFQEYIDVCEGQVTPQAEDCNTPEDEDCDGIGCDPPASVNLQLNFSQVKQFDFSWAPARGAQFYRLLERNVGEADYLQVGPDTMATAVSLPVTVLLHQRLGTSYVVQACNDFGCSDSAPVDVVGSMAEAIGYFKASNTEADDMFGSSVALSGDGDTLAVGCMLESSNAIGIDGNQADNSASQSGAVYVFVRDGQNTWSQQAYVKASNTGAHDYFGATVALSEDGDTLAVSAWIEASNAVGIDGDQANNSANYAGAAYVFARDGQGVWAQQAYIKASNSGAEDWFGYGMALSDDGNTLAVGALGEDSAATGINGNQADDSASSAGAVYVFVRDGQSTWSQQSYVKASNAGSSDMFGIRVALSGDGDTLAVAAAGEDSAATGIGGNQADNSVSFAGAVYVFVRDGQSTWSQQAYVKASNPGEDDWFGDSVALSADGNTLAVAASREDSSATGIDGTPADNSAIESGAVYLFVRDGQSAWSQQAYVKASNSGTNDYFGASVVLSGDGDILAVGASSEASNAIGVGGNQADNSIYSGAAYVFVRDGQSAWSQQAYIKASNSGSGDSFGQNMALSNNAAILVVAAPYEASNALGISGDALDDSAPGSGAVYIY